MRILLASTAGAGHLGPLLPFADSLQRSGHEVEFVVPAGADPSVEGRGYRVTKGGDPPKEEMDRLWRRFAAAGPEEARRLAEREVFAIRCTSAMMPTLADVVAERRPDLIIREPCEYASAVTAVRQSIPLGTVAISFAEAEWSVLDFIADILDAHQVGTRDALATAPFLTRFPRSLDPSPFPRTERYRDQPATSEARAQSDPWMGRPHPHLYVTFGSRVGGAPLAPDLYQATLEAMADVRAQVLFTVGREFELSTVTRIPDNVRLLPWVRQADVLVDCDAVICHGGSGTTLGALACGLPIGFVPLFADQPANAARVARAGAGLRLAARAVDGVIPQIDPSYAPAIRAMAGALLEDCSYRAAALKLAQELEAQPDIALVAERLTGEAATRGDPGLPWGALD